MTDYANTIRRSKVTEALDVLGIDPHRVTEVSLSPHAVSAEFYGRAPEGEKPLSMKGGSDGIEVTTVMWVIEEDR